MCPFRNKVTSYCEVFLALRPPPRLEDKTLSALGDSLFNIFTATLHIGSCFSIRNLRRSHAVLPVTNLSGHVAESYNLRHVSCSAWEFMLDEELNEIKITYLEKNRNRKLLRTQPTIHFLIIFLAMPRLNAGAILKS